MQKQSQHALKGLPIATWFWRGSLPTPGAWTVSFFVNGVLVQSDTVVAL